VQRIITILSVACLVATVAGCSATGRSADGPTPTWVAGAPASTSVATPKSKETPVAKITGACPLLSASELKSLLGGGTSSTRLTEAEAKPETGGVTRVYTCKYGSGGKYPFELSAMGDSDSGGYTPAYVIGAITKGSKVTTHEVSGLGDAAVFYTLPDGNSILAASKKFGHETRTVVFSAPKVVPQKNFEDVLNLVVQRI